MKLSIATFDDWSGMAYAVIRDAVLRAISDRGRCSLMLTGGRTAERLYAYWAGAGDLPVDRITYYFGDERCVPPDHADSNFGMAIRTLFGSRLPEGCTVHRMRAEDADRECAARDYEALLPDAIDILLLGVGTDGHVASLFPHGEALTSGDKRVVPSIAPATPRDRLTITSRVVAAAGEVFLLATGEEKGGILAAASKSPCDIAELPVRLALEGTWLVDEAAMAAFSSMTSAAPKREVARSESSTGRVGLAL